MCTPIFYHLSRYIYVLCLYIFHLYVPVIDLSLHVSSGYYVFLAVLLIPHLSVSVILLAICLPITLLHLRIQKLGLNWMVPSGWFLRVFMQRDSAVPGC